MSRLTKYAALARREVQETWTGSVITPALIMAVVVLVTVLALSAVPQGGISIGDEGPDINSFAELLDRVGQEAEGDEDKLMSTFLLGVSLPLALATYFIVFFTLLGSLYEDRRDRSFLFWKSMPVSDTEEVLARFLGGALLPFVTVNLVTLAGLLVLLVCATVVGLAQGANVGLLWQIGPYLQLWLLSFPLFVLMMLWMLPLTGWVLFASSVAPRAPFAFAVLPPVLAMAIEGVVFNSGRVAEWLGRRIVPMAGDDGIDDVDGFGEFYDSLSAMMLGDWLDLPTMPEFYVSILVGAAFIALAIWRRRYTS
ncbi:ABC-2 type transport system permease protein [Rhodothalassium salexigens DSM 2132]|uniref:ABC-2 type transport system permease protein n=1 Tax=Rhodothalassium salexigens DSM 2132 TaxID=1188247 RepID=A0A4R2PDG2_RHOSA|nr:ABC-2 transporter permease [Rhodothalassium salexigens]MBB4212414.1 ABC-2 type transport system permease protein [Rhodothalassium salexigens DSM 2132]MBK1637835.1 hypothetical protein [Rhodothalassium salexigens DSM 2132]TCP31955.1 ABC-2 type transport system permease protein [Rhodothalassium salexigens DSM 2132]